MAGKELLPVMLVTGSITPADLSYGNVLAELGNDANVVLKDLELYAGDVPPTGYGLDTEADGIKQAADEAGFDTFHLVGYSGGGASSLVYAARYPERLRSLALIEPAWIGNEGWTDDEIAYWKEIDRLMGLPPAERMEGFTRLNAGSGKVSSPAGPPPNWMAKRPAGLDAIVAAFGRQNLDLERLRRFDRPVYVAVGGLSHPSERSKAERLSTIFPDLRIEVYPDRHHMDPPHRAEAARFTRSLRELWDRAEQWLAKGSHA